MKKTAVFLLLISAYLTGFSQDTDYAKKVIEKLSSPGFKGRGYVENGDRISAEFISKEFQTMGLLPGNKKSYFQKFDIPVNTLPGKVSLKIDGTELKPAIVEK